jgi:hypothetical protein
MGAPLEKGALCDGRLRCQWHGACFNVKTGDIEDYPCSDALQTYGVRMEGQNAFVRGKPETFKSHKARAPLFMSLEGAAVFLCPISVSSENDRNLPELIMNQFMLTLRSVSAPLCPSRAATRRS